MNDLNHAIALYVGWNVSLYPNEDEIRVLSHFGEVEGTKLVERVRLILEELQQIQPNWEEHDLVSASKCAVESLASRHSTLNDEARAALEWIYSWWWK
jgi:hypothetical protein